MSGRPGTCPRLGAFASCWPSTSACTWMLTVAVEVSFCIPLLLTTVSVKRPASIEPLMNMSLFWDVLMIPDKTVTHSGLVLVVAGINVRAEVW